jgi:hypothetical protein
MTGFPVARRRRDLRCYINIRAASARSTNLTLPLWADFVEKLSLD